MTPCDLSLCLLSFPELLTPPETHVTAPSTLSHPPASFLSSLPGLRVPSPAVTSASCSTACSALVRGRGLTRSRAARNSWLGNRERARPTDCEPGSACWVQPARSLMAGRPVDGLRDVRKAPARSARHEVSTFWFRISGGERRRSRRTRAPTGARAGHASPPHPSQGLQEPPGGAGIRSASLRSGTAPTLWAQGWGGDCGARHTVPQTAHKPHV